MARQALARTVGIVRKTGKGGIGMRGIRSIGWVATAAGLALLLAIGPATTAFAAGGTLQVSGVLIPDQDGSCHEDPASQYTLDATGNLQGCWYFESLDPAGGTPSGAFRGSGTERFIGCLDGNQDKCGSFVSTFTTTAKYDTASGTEEHGRCNHEIVGGEGYFAGASGVINMHDDPNGCIYYKGHITLGSA
jgi:hypothetical protein